MFTLSPDQIESVTRETCGGKVCPGWKITAKCVGGDEVVYLTTLGPWDVVPEHSVQVNGMTWHSFTGRTGRGPAKPEQAEFEAMLEVLSDASRRWDDDAYLAKREASNTQARELFGVAS